jgi:hypothetical protein
MAAGLLLARPFPLRMGELGEVTQVKAWENLFIVHEPDPEAGPGGGRDRLPHPPEDADAFLDALTQLKAWRRRDGATFWRVYRDLADPSRFLERFIVTSWADYLHQRSRATVADLALEADVRAFLLPGELATTEHYIAER